MFLNVYGIGLGLAYIVEVFVNPVISTLSDKSGVVFVSSLILLSSHGLLMIIVFSILLLLAKQEMYAPTSWQRSVCACRYGRRKPESGGMCLGRDIHSSY